MPPHQRCLFPKVWSVAGNYRPGGNMALPTFTGQAVSATATRTCTAFFQHCSGFLGPGLQLSSVIKLLVGCYLPYSSTSRFFLFFLNTSTVTGGCKIGVADTCLVSFFCFFDSRCLISRRPMVTPLFVCSLREYLF